MNNYIKIFIKAYLVTLLSQFALSGLIWALYLGELSRPQFNFFHLQGMLPAFIFTFTTAMQLKNKNYFNIFISTILLFCIYQLIEYLTIVPLFSNFQIYIQENYSDKINPRTRMLIDPKLTSSPGKSLLFFINNLNIIIKWLPGTILGVFTSFIFMVYARNMRSIKNINKGLYYFGTFLKMFGIFGYIVAILFCIIGVTYFFITSTFPIIWEFVRYWLFWNHPFIGIVILIFLIFTFTEIAARVIRWILLVTVSFIILEFISHFFIAILFFFRIIITMIGFSYLYHIGRRINSITKIPDEDYNLLLLRSFYFDLVHSKSLIGNVYGYLTFNYESPFLIINSIFEKLKIKFITISNPNDNLPQWCKSYIHFGDNWKEQVYKAIKKSNIIVIIIGETEGLLTEVNMVVDLNCLHKTIIYSHNKISIDHWNKFWKTLLDRKMINEVPEFLPINRDFYTFENTNLILNNYETLESQLLNMKTKNENLNQE